MGKRQRVIRVIELWCGGSPERGSDKLRALWERHGPNGVPFDDEGAERLIRGLDQEFLGHRLRPVDVLEFDVNALVNAIPNRLVAVAATVGASAAATTAPSPVLVQLTDDTIERLATRIAAIVQKKAAARPRRTSKKGSGSAPKSVRRKQR